MKEDLLQFIWKFQYFNHRSLRGVNGEKIAIIQPGIHNTDQGPDFLNARVRINDTLWAGNVEIHKYSKEWNRHHHHEDERYNNVILHVIWKYDQDIKTESNAEVTALELYDRVPKMLLEKYEFLKNKDQDGLFIPCEKHLHLVSTITREHWKHRLLAEKLILRSEHILQLLQHQEMHWEEIFWRLLAENFGMRVNRSFFYDIAASLPIKTLARHTHNIVQMEAMLFGQAGLLEGVFRDKYPRMLQKEYRYLAAKYHLIPVDGHIQFLRMRPANFPTIRLAQLAALICESRHLFSKVKDAQHTRELMQLLGGSPNDYWLYHYKFDDQVENEKPGAYKEKELGRQMMENIIINTIAPIIFSFGQYHKEQIYKDKALEWLEQLPAETNRITKKYKALGFPMTSAFDSQAWIHLKNKYCNEKRCLHCAIGHQVLKKDMG